MFERLKHALGISPVPKAMVDKWMKGYEFTPDFHELEQFKHRLVFLYGGTRETTSLGIEPIWDGLTENDFVMVKYKEGERAFPIVVDPPHDTLSRHFKVMRAPIAGKIFQLTAGEIKSLDNFYSNGVVFKRQPVKIVIPYKVKGEKDGEVIETDPLTYVKKCFMYVGSFDYWNLMPLDRTSHRLLKEREHNKNYKAKYYFTPSDW